MSMENVRKHALTAPRIATVFCIVNERLVVLLEWLLALIWRRIADRRGREHWKALLLLLPAGGAAHEVAEEKPAAAEKAADQED